MIEIGAAAYLPKNSEPTEVAETIQAVAVNGFHYNKKVMEIIRENFISKNNPAATVELSVSKLTQKKRLLLQTEITLQFVL